MIRRWTSNIIFQRNHICELQRQLWNEMIRRWASLKESGEMKWFKCERLWGRVVKWNDLKVNVKYDFPVKSHLWAATSIVKWNDLEVNVFGGEWWNGMIRRWTSNIIFQRNHICELRRQLWNEMIRRWTSLEESGEMKWFGGEPLWMRVVNWYQLHNVMALLQE